VNNNVLKLCKPSENLKILIPIITRFNALLLACWEIYFVDTSCNTGLKIFDVDGFRIWRSTRISNLSVSGDSEKCGSVIIVLRNYLYDVNHHKCNFTLQN